MSKRCIAGAVFSLFIIFGHITKSHAQAAAQVMQNKDSLTIGGLQRSYELGDKISFSIHNDTTREVSVLVGLQRMQGGEWKLVSEDIWGQSELGVTRIAIIDPHITKPYEWDMSGFRETRTHRTKSGKTKLEQEKLRKGRYRLVMKWGFGVKAMEYYNYSAPFSLK